MPFISVESINGHFSANGIVGLAPGGNEESFVNHLFEQGQIPKRVVGLNFEDPTDRSQVSTITFGYIDYNQIRGGEDGFNYYSNIGLNHWAVMLDDM